MKRERERGGGGKLYKGEGLAVRERKRKGLATKERETVA